MMYFSPIFFPYNTMLQSGIKYIIVFTTLCCILEKNTSLYLQHYDVFWNKIHHCIYKLCCILEKYNDAFYSRLQHSDVMKKNWTKINHCIHKTMLYSGIKYIIVFKTLCCILE